MQLKPDDVPDLIEGEIRRVTCNLSGAVGVNTISSATATSDTLTIGTPSISGTSINFLLTASQVGTHYVLVSCTLSSAETIKGRFRAKVQAETCASTSGDYDE